MNVLPLEALNHNVIQKQEFALVSLVMKAKNVIDVFTVIMAILIVGGVVVIRQEHLKTPAMLLVFVSAIQMDSVLAR